MKSVSEFDDEYTDVFCHCHKEFAHALYVALLAAILNLAELSDAFDEKEYL